MANDDYIDQVLAQVEEHRARDATRRKSDADVAADMAGVVNKRPPRPNSPTAAPPRSTRLRRSSAEGYGGSSGGERPRQTPLGSRLMRGSSRRLHDA
jgi:hypothetical protein